MAAKSTQHLAGSDLQAIAIRADENFIHSLLCHAVSASPLGAQWLKIVCICLYLPKTCLSLGAGLLPSCGEVTSAESPGKKVGKGKGIQCSSQISSKGQAMNQISRNQWSHVVCSS